MKRFITAIIIIIAIAGVSYGIWWAVENLLLPQLPRISPLQVLLKLKMFRWLRKWGRITDITADEGDNVTSGAVLVKLDGAILSKQRDEAVAAVNLAGANLNQAIITRDGALKILQDAQDVQNNPIQLNGQIEAARNQLDIANLDLLREQQIESELNVPAAQVNLETAKKVLENLQNENSTGLIGFYQMQEKILPAEGNVQLSELNLQYLRDLETRWRIPEVQTKRDMAQAALDNLLAISANPQEIKSAVTKARAVS